MSWKDFDDYFGTKITEAAQGLAPEHLAATTDLTYEITINIPQKKLSIQQHSEVYKNTWEHLKKVYKSVADGYHIEECVSRQFHIHGYLTVQYPVSILNYDEEVILRGLAREIYKILPKVYYKQLANLKYNAHLKRLKGPAVCLNLKEVLHKNWENYITKNASKK